jgi:hypothetical protein
VIRLGDLTAQQRARYGWAMLVVGTVTMAIAVIVVHYANLPESEAVGGAFGWIPRGWFPKSIGYVMAFGASQLLVAGAAIAFLLGRPMTWAGAAFGAFLAWMELVIIFGIVPSEWLNLSQTDLDWSATRIAVTIPPWLVLGNQVDISFAVVKDIISMGYNGTMLVVAAVFAYKFRDIIGPSPAKTEKPEKMSPYGRPLVRSDS